jgi:superfamily II DNA/RNA helicase
MAARGLDLPRLSHVINFDPAGSLREYVHRVGRVARLSSRTPGRAGTALTFVMSDAEQETLVGMCTELGVSLSELSILEGEPVVTQLLGPVPDMAAWRRGGKARSSAVDRRAAAAAEVAGTVEAAVAAAMEPARSQEQASASA